MVGVWPIYGIGAAASCGSSRLKLSISLPRLDEARAPRRAERTRHESRDGEPRRARRQPMAERGSPAPPPPAAQLCVDVPAAAASDCRPDDDAFTRSRSAGVSSSAARHRRSGRLPRSRLPGQTTGVDAACARAARSPSDGVTCASKQSWVQPAARSHWPIRPAPKLARAAPQTHPNRRPCLSAPFTVGVALARHAPDSSELPGAALCRSVSTALRARPWRPAPNRPRRRRRADPLPPRRTAALTGPPSVWASLHEGTQQCQLI